MLSECLSSDIQPKLPNLSIFHTISFGKKYMFQLVFDIEKKMQVPEISSKHHTK